MRGVVINFLCSFLQRRSCEILVFSFEKISFRRFSDLFNAVTTEVIHTHLGQHVLCK